jgi:hypothetical protein
LKKPVDKHELRRQLLDEIDSFLAQGGEIEHVETGESAYSPGQRPPSTPLFNEPKTSRTPVDDVVAALDQRREAQRNPPKPSRKSPQKPTREIIYDDFGEPMRVVWKE